MASGGGSHPVPVGFRADLPALRERQPGLTSLDAWVSERWTVPAEPVPAV
ncbi:hypothetical protein ACFYPA_17955 [Streptomyces sp. NPDC005775]